MKAILPALAMVAFLGSPVLADPWKDESGKGRWHYGGPVYDYDYDYDDREYKEEFWAGNCKIEREWDDGEYKEERECKGKWD